jgi:preprotein translocase subunit SecF
MPIEIVKPNINFDFMRLRRYSLALALLSLLVALIALPVRGLNFALDFTGGTLVELSFEKPADLSVIRESLERAGYVGAVVQTFGASNEVVVRLQPRAGARGGEALQAVEPPAAGGEPTGAAVRQTADAVLAAVSTADNPATINRSDFVGPQVGKELAENGLIAVMVVAFGFLVYISARFEWKFALAAIVTTLHDVVLVVGFFAITQKEFDLVVLAGVLSVMGFSINDTIVVFDRVRENFRALHKLTPVEVLNRSVNQTLSRTILTSVVAFLTVLALYLYGGSSLELMAVSQMLGIVIGTLSSIFVACPLLLLLGVQKQDLMPKARDLEELERRP